MTYNWDPEDYQIARAFGHLAYEVDDIYVACQRLQDHGVTINRPPRDGRMAFVRSPDRISIELLQKGASLAAAGTLDVDAEHWRVVVWSLGAVVHGRPVLECTTQSRDGYEGRPCRF